MKFNILAKGSFKADAGEVVEVILETTRCNIGQPIELRFVKDGAVTISCEGQLLIDKLHNTRAVVRLYSNDSHALDQFIQTYLVNDDDTVRLTIGHNTQDLTYCGLLDMEGIEYYESTAYGYVLELVFGDLNPLKRIKADVVGGLYSLKQICNDWVDVITTPQAVGNGYTHLMVQSFLSGDDFKFDKSLAGEDPSVYDVLEVYAEAMGGSLRQVGGCLRLLTAPTAITDARYTDVDNVVEGVSYATGRAYNTFEYNLKGEQVRSREYSLLGVDKVIQVERGKKCSTLPTEFYNQKDDGYRRGRGDQDYYQRATHSSRPANSFVTKKGAITPAVSETKREQYILGFPIYNEEYIDGELAFGKQIDVDISRLVYRTDEIKGVVAQLEEVKKGITYGELIGQSGEEGGRNLLKPISGLRNSNSDIRKVVLDGNSLLWTQFNRKTQPWTLKLHAPFPDGTYTLSYKCSVGEKYRNNIYYTRLDNGNGWDSRNTTTTTTTTELGDGSWLHTITFKELKASKYSSFFFYGTDPFDPPKEVRFWDFKFEKGTVVTDWSPAPEDVVVLMRDYYLATASYWDVLAEERNSPKDAENAKLVRAESDKLGESDRFVKDIEAMRRLFTAYISELNGIIANKEATVKQMRELDTEPATAIAHRKDDTAEWRSGFVMAHGKDLFNLESTASLRGVKAKIKAKGNKTPISISIGGGTAVLGDDIRDFLDEKVPDLYMSTENEIPHLLLEVDITCSGGGKSYVLNANSQSEKAGTKWVADDTIAPEREHNYLDLGQVLSEELGATINLPPLPEGVDTVDVTYTGKWYVGFENFTWALVESKDIFNLFKWSDEARRKAMVEKYEQLCRHDWGIIFYLDRFEVSQGLEIAYKDRKSTLTINDGRQFDEVLTYETRIGTALGIGANLLDSNGAIIHPLISKEVTDKNKAFKKVEMHESFVLYALSLLYSRRYNTIEFRRTKCREDYRPSAFIKFIDTRNYFVQKYEFDLSSSAVTCTARELPILDDASLMTLAEQASLAMTAGSHASGGGNGITRTTTGRRR